MEFKPLYEDGVAKLNYSRQDLEELVRESRIIRQSRPKTDFFDNDFHAIQRLQKEGEFLIINIGEFNKDHIDFTGRFFEDGVLSDKKIEVKVKDLDHETSARFAYAVYQLVKSNNQKYKQVLGRQSYVYRNDLESYFKKKLSKYLNT